MNTLTITILNAYNRIITLFFVFIFIPVSSFVFVISALLEYFGIKHIDAKAISFLLPFLPFLSFIFVIIFLFNGAFWMGVFSCDSTHENNPHNHSP